MNGGVAQPGLEHANAIRQATGKKFKSNEQAYSENDSAV